MGVIRLFAKVEVIGAPLESPHTGACKGCMTSLVSMTRDAAASAALYPDLWSRLGRLCAASHTMAKHLSTSGVRNLFIYNGRVASVRAISRRFADSDDHTLRVYEYGSKFGTYRIARYSIHDFAFRSEQLVDYAKKTIFAFDEKRASNYIEQKLKNRFTRTYSSEPVPHYETVLFGGTPYEYSNSLDAGDHLDSDPLLMLRTAAAHPDFLRPAAFRIHPNASTAHNQPEFNEAISALCKELDIDLIAAEHPVSSHQLIRQATRVMVGGSSVALDAYFLGKTPIFLGDNTYRGLIEEVDRTFVGSSNNALRIAGVILGFQPSEWRPFPPWAWVILVIRSGVSKLRFRATA